MSIKDKVIYDRNGKSPDVTRCKEFLDELERATPEVMVACLKLVDDFMQSDIIKETIRCVNTKEDKAGVQDIPKAAKSRFVGVPINFDKYVEDYFANEYSSLLKALDELSSCAIRDFKDKVHALRVHESLHLIFAPKTDIVKEAAKEQNIEHIDVCKHEPTELTFIDDVNYADEVVRDATNRLSAERWLDTRSREIAGLYSRNPSTATFSRLRQWVNFVAREREAIALRDPLDFKGIPYVK